MILLLLPWCPHLTSPWSGGSAADWSINVFIALQDAIGTIFESLILLLAECTLIVFGLFYLLILSIVHAIGLWLHHQR